jgi:hypothetical protein
VYVVTPISTNSNARVPCICNLPNTTGRVRAVHVPGESVDSPSVVSVPIVKQVEVQRQLGESLWRRLGVDLGRSVSPSFLLSFKFGWITVLYDVGRFLPMNVDCFPALRCVVSYNSGILHSQRILGDRRIVPARLLCAPSSFSNISKSHFIPSSMHRR